MKNEEGQCWGDRVIVPNTTRGRGKKEKEGERKRKRETFGREERGRRKRSDVNKTRVWLVLIGNIIISPINTLIVASSRKK